MPCFFISHRSYIVNLEYVSKFDHSLIYFSGNKMRAYLTRRKYTQFKDAYLIYLESTR
ncbi:MAG: LytTR family transcriptional regulator DNA-binding domain-containing protein [Eubacterium sp.]|uniref:LytTR family transcriptional regulator DNA-binding domain-containing protein n=1 Tax=Eubacterium sp. TaxID=142586 RepID=UPI00300F0E7F